MGLLLLRRHAETRARRCGHQPTIGPEREQPARVHISRDRLTEPQHMDTVLLNDPGEAWTMNMNEGLGPADLRQFHSPRHWNIVVMGAEHRQVIRPHAEAVPAMRQL